MSFDPSDAQAWEDSGHDPLGYLALMTERGLIGRDPRVPPPEEVGVPVSWEPVGSEEPKPREVSPWRHEHSEYCSHPWH